MNKPIQRCPKWEGCNAPTCPLDPHRLQTRTEKDDKSCLWLREAMKPEGVGVIPLEIASAVREALPGILQHCGAVLRARLVAAAKKGSKVALGRAEQYRRTETKEIPATLVPAQPTGKAEGYLDGAAA
jgi:hypothetical protein